MLANIVARYHPYGVWEALRYPSGMLYKVFTATEYFRLTVRASTASLQQEAVTAETLSEFVEFKYPLMLPYCDPGDWYMKWTIKTSMQ
jgi:hypothetical protein